MPPGRLPRFHRACPSTALDDRVSVVSIARLAAKFNLRSLTGHSTHEHWNGSIGGSGRPFDSGPDLAATRKPL